MAEVRDFSISGCQNSQISPQAPSSGGVLALASIDAEEEERMRSPVAPFPLADTG